MRTGGWVGCIATAIAALGMPFAAVAAEDMEEAATERWAGAVNLGASLTTGNVDSFSGNLEGTLMRIWERDRLLFELKGIYGKADGTENADAQSIFGDYRHNFTDRFYTYLNSEFGRDDIQFIEWRYIGNAGPGYRLWEASESRFLDAELGIGYRHEVYTNTTPTRDDALGRVAYEYKDLWGEVLEVGHGFEFLLPFDDTDAWFLRSGVFFAVPLVNSWFFRTAFDLQYLNAPAVGADGLDTKTTVGLEYRF